MKGKTFSDQYDMAYGAIETALVSVKDLVNRTESLAALRRKENRALSRENRERLEVLLVKVQELAISIDKVLDVTAVDRANIDENESEKRIKAIVDQIAKK